MTLPALALGQETPPDEGSQLSPGITPETEELVDAQLETQAQHREWLEGPEAAAARKRSLSAYLDLSAVQARELLEQEFSAFLRGATGVSAVDQEAVLKYVDDRTALVEGEDGSPALVESSLPLATEEAGGGMQPVDASLKRVGGRLETANALADVSLPAKLDGEIALGGSGGIGISLAGADPGADWLRVGETGAIYANAREDRDLLVTTRPTGIELSTVIRSPEAAETDRFELSLPSGASFRELPDGSIGIESAGEALGRVAPPVAFDAQGQSVPVEMRPEGDSVVLETDLEGDWAYPVLVDPLVEYFLYSYGGFSTDYWPASQTAGSPYTVCPGGNPSICNFYGGRLWIYGPSGSYPAGAVGQKSMTVPNGTSNPDSTTAWISSASFTGVSWVGNPGQSTLPYLLASIYNPRAGSDNASYLALGNQSAAATINLAPAGTPPGPVDDGQVLRFMNADLSGVPTTHTAQTNAGAETAVATFEDPEAPTQQITANTFPTSGWVTNPDTEYSITVSANDPGLGVKSIRLYKPNAGGTFDLGEPVKYELAEQFPSPPCTGGRLVPCPQNLAKTFTYTTAAMPEGRHKLFAESWDPLGGDHFDRDTPEVRIDRSAPTIELSGSLTEAEGDDLADRTYELKVTARDGSDESPDQERSGVKDIEVLLDGQQVAYQPQGCATSSCEQELTYPLNAANLTAGPHTLEVKSTDQVGNPAASKKLYLSAEGFAGVIVTPKSGDTTARRFGLTAERRDPSMTHVTFQYRRPGATSWQAIPAAQLTLDADGTHPASTLLALDSNGKSPPVTWEVPPTPGIDGVDGKVNLRARFSAGAGSDPARANAALLWRFGESEGTTATDSSGNDRAGAYVGSPTLKQPHSALGPADDGAVSLNGTSQSITSGWEARRNLLANPSLETDTGSWAAWGSPSSWGRTTSQAQSGLASVKVTGAPSGAGVLNASGAVAGKYYSAAAQLRALDWNSGAAPGFKLSLLYLNSSFGLLRTDPVSTPAWESWNRVTSDGSSFGPAPAGTAMVWLTVTNQWSTSRDFYVDSVQLEEGPTIGSYFDGSSAGARWEGTANNSLSRIDGPFENGSARTYTGWAYRDSSSTADILFGGSSQTEPARLRLEAGSNNVSWRANGTNGATKTWTNAWPGNGVWVHWALVFNESANTVALYINGSIVSTQTDTDTFSASPGSFMAGARGIPATPDYFAGKLDEYAVYTSAMSASDIADIYANGPHKGYSQVVPLTLDRDDTTAKHASSPIGPGSVDLLTGNFAHTADDVSIASYGSDLTVSRTFNSREASTSGALDMFGPGWTPSIPVDAAGSDYVSLIETGPSGDKPASVTITTSDSTEILFSRKGSGYEVEPMFAGLELAQSGAQYVLKDPSGNTTTFYKPSGSSFPDFVPQKVSQTGNPAQTTTRFGYASYAGAGLRPVWALAPTPAGVSCLDSQEESLLNPLPRGCRVLVFSNAAGGFKKLTDKITFRAWDPATSSIAQTDVAQYEYYPDGRLMAAWDPRISPALKTTYAYDAFGQLTTITPPGENAWTLSYQTISNDPNGGRLKSASRSVPGGGTQKQTAFYGVPLEGSGAPYEMGPGDVDDWAQSDVPTDATAIFPPDQDPGSGTPSSYSRATVTYMNRNGDAVDVAAPGGEIATSEYESHRQVRRTLSAANRQRALVSSDPATTAQKLDVQNTYSADGIDLLETLGPEHQVVLDNGDVVDARAHTVTTYDEGAPSGKDYHLPTTVQTGARVSGQSGADSDVRTTKTEYAWSLRQPTATIADPGSGKLNLKTQTLYDSASGLPTERRLPKANAQGTDAHTTKTVYYSASANSAHPECGNRPEWANLACKSLPGGQPSGSAPGLPTTTYEYNLWNQPTTVTDDPTESGVLNRVATTTYDAAGRPTQSALSGGQGTAVASVTTGYSSTTGRATTTTADGRTITRGYDAIGRMTSYTDADGQASVTTYDLLDRPTSVSDGKGTTTYTYEAASGRLATVSSPNVGTFSADAYDADGNLLQETAPNGLQTSFSYDAAGNPTAKAYAEPGCSVGCTSLSFVSGYSIHGQLRSDSSASSAVGSQSQAYTYDAAGRLTRVADTIATDCTTRHYAYDDDSNRASSRTVPPLSGGACDTGSGGTTRNHSYDEADRVTDSGYSYDAFGRTTAVPAADAGGSALSATYFADDMVRTLTQGGTTRTFDLDPARRVRVRSTSGGAPAELYHYSDDSDSPAWVDLNGPNDAWERYVSAPSGMLGATQRGEGSTATGASFQLTNLHGDVVAEASSSGDITDSFDAGEFGAPISGGLPDSGYGWLGGKERRSQFDSGIITMGARVYVPDIGRFLQIDSVLGGSANTYDYGDQDPVNQLDLGGEVPRPRAFAACYGTAPGDPKKIGGGSRPGYAASIETSMSFNCGGFNGFVITKVFASLCIQQKQEASGTWKSMSCTKGRWTDFPPNGYVEALLTEGIDCPAGKHAYRARGFIDVWGHGPSGKRRRVRKWIFGPSFSGVSEIRC